MNTHTSVPVTAAPFIDPSVGRIDVTMPVGMTVAEIVNSVLPGAQEDQLSRCRVALVTHEKKAIIPRKNWHRVRPYPGVHVVIRVVPAKSALRSILQVVVSIAAIALGQFWLGPIIAGAFGISTQVANAFASLALSALGNLLISALIPPPRPADPEKEKPTYIISGFRNAFAPDSAVPEVLGRHRFAPPYAASTWTEIVGDEQFIRAIFCVGYGPKTISDIKLGDTLIEKYEEVQLEIREGLEDDDPISLYPQQVYEEQVGAELTRPRPRDTDGEIQDDEPGIETPVTRFTAKDTAESVIIIGFPGGLIKYNDEGEDKSQDVTIRIRYRAVGTVPWTEVDTIEIRARKREAVYRSFRWSYGVRSQYEVELTRITNERTDPQSSDRSVWVALQSLRPEYPLNFDKPLALIGVRVKATHQLNQTIDNLNAIVESVCLDWDSVTETWIERETRNPASLFRHMLQGPSNSKPVSDASIDLDLLIEWHEFCSSKGLKYDRIHDFTGSLYEQLVSVCAAGRAAPRHDGIKWGVVIDRPQELVIDHVNTRNSRSFQWRRTYFEAPHAFRVPFIDETNDYIQGERIVPWPDYEGDITLTEELPLPGKTDPDEIWVEARRRQYELIHRADRFTATQDGAARVATRGDLLMASYDTLVRTQVATRVIDVQGNLIVLDEPVTMEEGIDYACRFRKFDEEDTIGESIVRSLSTQPGTRSSITVTGAGELPEVGDIIHFGISTTESLPVILSRVEPGENFSGVITMLPAAEIIDTLTDAEVPPAWDGRVGEILDPDLTAPSAPYFTKVSSGIDAGTDDPTALILEFAPGTSNTVVVDSFTVQHRLLGSGTWIDVIVPATDGSADLSGIYASADTVEIQVFATSIADVDGPAVGPIEVVMGENDEPIPEALPASTVLITGGLGHATINFSTGSDTATVAVQVWRDGVALGLPIAVEPNSTFQKIDGDATRTTLVTNGEFSADANWTKVNTTISGGTGNKAAGVSGSFTQALSLTPGDTLRYSIEMLNRTAGNGSLNLTGGTTTILQSGMASNTVFRGEGVVGAGNTNVQILFGTTFAGSVDNVKLYVKTSGCAPQGAHSYELEPINADGIGGPKTSAVVVNID